MLNINLNGDKMADILEIVKNVFADVSPLLIILIGLLLGVFVVEAIVGLFFKKQEEQN